MDGWVDGWMGGWVDGWMGECRVAYTVAFVCVLGGEKIFREWIRMSELNAASDGGEGGQDRERWSSVSV